MKKVYKQLKYKSLLRLRDVFYCKKRILNFKRPKWAFLKKKIFFKFFKRQGMATNKLRTIKNVKTFNNQFVLYSPLRWVYLKSLYRNSLLSKVRLLLFFRLKTPIKNLKNYYKEGNLLSQIESRLDVCLWRAGFFESPAVARFFINHKNVYVNDSLQNLSCTKIKEGDILRVSKQAQKYVINFLLFRKLGDYNKKFIILEKFKLLYLLAPYLEINTNSLEVACISLHTKKLSTAYLYNTNFDLPALRYYLKQL